MSYIIYRITLTQTGFVPEIIGTSNAKTAIDALHDKGFKNAIGDKIVMDYNHKMHFATQWIEALNPDNIFWSPGIERNV